jgi:hypothetical protein
MIYEYKLKSKYDIPNLIINLSMQINYEKYKTKEHYY